MDLMCPRVRVSGDAAMPTVVEPLGLPLQGGSRREGLDAAAAATRAFGSIQGHHDVAQLRRAEAAAVDQLALLDDATADS